MKPRENYIMPKKSQNIVILLEPKWMMNPWEMSSKSGNMFLNRFCVEEDAGFELSGVHFFQKWIVIMKKGEGKHNMCEEICIL